MAHVKGEDVLDRNPTCSAAYRAEPDSARSEPPEPNSKILSTLSEGRLILNFE